MLGLIEVYHRQIDKQAWRWFMFHTANDHKPNLDKALNYGHLRRRV